MGQDKYILAIDHGTSGCKVALISVRGEIVTSAFSATPIEIFAGGGAEQDPDDWWRAFLESAQAVLSQDLVAIDDIVGVGCSSTFSTTVAVDADGRHLMNALTWLDSRGAPHVKRLMGGFPSLYGYAISNILRWVPRAGGAPTLSGKDSIAHMLWVQHERPDVYKKAAWFLESKDYFNLRLTGQCAASQDSATLFWVTDTRDIHHVAYSDVLIRRLGIDKAKLPPLKRSIDVLGPLRDDVAEQLGLPRGLPVVVGSPDLQSACVGSGAVRPFAGHVYIGTSSWILCHVPFKKTDVLHAIASLPSAIPGMYFCANEQDVAGGCLSFLIRNILDRDPLEMDSVFEEVETTAAQAPPGSNKLIFTPWLNGEKTPVDDITVRGGLHNISLSTTRADIARAIYEGVAFNSLWVLGHVERFVHRPLGALNIIGGGAQSDLWCQIYADVLNRGMRRTSEPILANARGAALIASVALGYIEFDDIPALVPIERTFHPEPDTREIYDELFREFIRIYRATHGIYRRLNG